MNYKVSHKYFQVFQVTNIFQVYRFDIQLLVQLWVRYETGIDQCFKERV